MLFDGQTPAMGREPVPRDIYILHQCTEQAKVANVKSRADNSGSGDAQEGVI